MFLLVKVNGEYLVFFRGCLAIFVGAYAHNNNKSLCFCRIKEKETNKQDVLSAVSVSVSFLECVTKNEPKYVDDYNVYVFYQRKGQGIIRVKISLYLMK